MERAPTPPTHPRNDTEEPREQQKNYYHRRRNRRRCFWEIKPDDGDQMVHTGSAFSPAFCAPVPPG